MSRPKSVRAEREFGLVVGGILLILGGWWSLRGKFGGLGPGFLTAGALLIGLGVVAPRVLEVPRRGWMALGEGLGFVFSHVILALVFFLVVTPIGVIRRLMGADPLRRRSPVSSSYWTSYPERQKNPRHYERMY